MNKLSSLLFLPILILSCFGCEQLNNQGKNLDSSLNDLFILDNSLRNNNSMLKDYSLFVKAQMAATAETKVQYLPLVREAKDLINLSNEFHSYIDKLRDQIVLEAGGLHSLEEAIAKGIPELEGKPLDIKNKDIPQGIFLTGDHNGENKEAQGEVLEKKILALKAAYLDLVAGLWDNGGIPGCIFADPTKKELAMKEVEEKIFLTSSENYDPSLHDNKTWAEFTFGGKSVAAIYPRLRKFQNDARLSEVAIINFIGEQIGKMVSGYDKFDLLVQPFKSCIRVGDTYESEIALGAYSSYSKISVSVDGKNLKVVGGKAKYTTKASNAGTQQYTAKVSITNPLTGKTESFSKEVTYEVGQ